MKWGAIVVLTVLLAATSTNAIAECTWILWHDLNVMVGGDSGTKEWTAAGTAKTFEQCVELRENALADHFKRLNSKDDNTPGAAKTSISRSGPLIVLTMPHGRSEIRYSCWPENRDPRH